MHSTPFIRIIRLVIPFLLVALVPTCMWATPPENDPGDPGDEANMRVFVKIISVEGNKKTKPKVILRELTFNKGDSVVMKNLDEHIARSQQNIYNLGLFNEVSIKHDVLDGSLFVFISVKERWYIFPAPQIRVEERNSYDLIDAVLAGDFHRLSYGIKIGWRNITGNNEDLYFFGQSGFTQRLALDYIRPGTFSNYTDLLIGIRYNRNDEIIYGTEEGRVLWGEVEDEVLQETQSYTLGVRHRFSLYKSLRGYLQYKDRRFSDSIYAFSERFLTNQRGREHYPSLVLQWVTDKRDVTTYPLDGHVFKVHFRHTGIPDVSSTSFSKAGFAWSQYVPLSERWFFAYGTQHTFTFGRDVPFFEKNVIGIGRTEFPGTSTNLRGYQPFVIDGSYVQLPKAELKFALVPRRIVHIKQIPVKRFQDMPFGLYLTAFLDNGYVQDETISNQDTFLKNRWLTGYGLGVNIITIYDRLVRIELARNHLGQNGIYFHSSLPIR